MRLTLQPNGHPASGAAPTSYRVELPHNEFAIIDRISDKGWQLNVRNNGRVIDRGLFATPDDVLAVLESEYYPQPTRD